LNSSRKGERERWRTMKIFIREIRENENVDSLFLVREKSSGLAKTGNAYLK